MQDYTMLSMMISSDAPGACASIRGGSLFPNIMGVARFHPVKWDVGTIVEIEIVNLPNTASYSPRFLGMHIHETGNCQNDFTETGMHYNPTKAVHPYHSGDLPPLLNNNGYSYMIFYDSFLNISDVTGRSIIIHEQRDDFTTQPSGDSGNKIACGVIRPCKAE